LFPGFVESAGIKQVDFAHEGDVKHRGQRKHVLRHPTELRFRGQWWGGGERMAMPYFIIWWGGEKKEINLKVKCAIESHRTPSG